MPFDGSGNFSRLYNWQSDRDNGIHILASRMDGEFDNFAAGMNVVFFRNGLVPMSGNLNMGQNYITGLGAGSVGALPLRFADDPNSGLYLNGFNKPTIVAGGNARLEANTTGVLVTGTLNSSGALTQNGQQVWHAGNLTPGDYMPKAGGVFTGNVQFRDASGATNGYMQTQPGGVGTTGYMEFNNAAGVRQAYIGFAPTGGQIQYSSDNGAGHRFFGGPVNMDGVALTVSGNAVWHAGNFNPNDYARLTANPVIFTGQVRARSGANGIIELIPGDSGNTGYIQFRTPGDVANGYIGYAATGGSINYVAQGGGGHAFANSVAVSGGITATGIIDAGPAMRVSGQEVWHAGNFNPAVKANLSGAAFTGGISATGVVVQNGAGNGQITLQSGGASNTGYIEWVNGTTGVRHSYVGFSASGGPLTFVNDTGGSGFTFTGGTVTMPTAVKTGQGQFVAHSVAGRSGSLSRGTTTPTGGSDGDIYFQHS